METLIPLVIGGAVGLFIGLQLLRARSPQIMIVQVERDDQQPTGGFGCLPLIVLVTLLALLMLLLPR